MVVTLVEVNGGSGLGPALSLEVKLSVLTYSHILNSNSNTDTYAVFDPLNVGTLP